MTTSRTTACDVYLSYAPSDHVIDQALQHSWVTGIASFLKAETASWGTPITVAYDLTDVDSPEAWQDRRGEIIQNSRILVPLLSPRYFSSASCMLEWEHFASRITHGDRHADHSPIQPVMLEDSAAATGDAVRAWQQSMTDLQHVDLQPWFAQGPSQLGNEELRTQLRALGRAILERLRINRLRSLGPGNVGLGATDFVGRRNATSELAASIGDPRKESSAQATLTCLTGISGVGKTTLALRYASNHRHIYPGGVWRLDARNHTHVLPLLSILATDRTLGAAKTLDDRTAAGKSVLTALAKRSHTTGPCLVLLDNITEPNLLSVKELQKLTSDGHLGVTWLATTSLPEEHIADAAEFLNILPVSPLSAPESMDLIAARRPDAAESPDNQDATLQLAQLLRGYPVAVDLASAYLGDRAELSITDLTNRLRRATASTQPGSPEHFSAILGDLVQHSVAELEPAAQSAAIIASMCTPEKTPWAWIERCTRLLHADTFSDAYLGKQNWLRIKHQLIRRGILTDTDRPELARMHSHLQALLSGFAAPGHIMALNRVVTERVAAFVNGERAHTWERVACLGALDLMVRRSPEDAAATLSSVEVLRPFSDLPDRLMEPVWTEHLRWCDEHARKHPNNPQAQLIHATALLNAGIIEQSADAHAATKRLESARLMAKQVNDVSPDPRAQRVVATATWMLSDPHNVDTAEEVVRLMSPLAQSPDAPYGLRVDAAVATVNLAQAVSKSEPQRALTMLQNSVSVLRALRSERSHHPTTSWALGVALQSQIPLVGSGESATAKGWGVEALEIATQSVAEWPQRIDMVTLKAHTLLNLGNTIASTSAEEALTHYDEAAKLIADVHEQLPTGDKGHIVRFEAAAAGLQIVCDESTPKNSAEWQRATNVLLALVPILRGVHPDMRSYCADALRWCQVVEKSSPSSTAQATAEVLKAIAEAAKRNAFSLTPAQRITVPTVWLTVAAVQEQHAPLAALESSRLAIVDLQRESTAAGHNVEILTLLSSAYLFAARIAETTTDVDSLAFYQQALATNQSLLQHEPSRAPALNAAGICLMKISTLDAPAEARTLSSQLDQAVSYLRSANAQRPTVQGRRQLGEALLRAGKSYQSTSRATSLSLLRESRQVWQELSEQGLANSQDLTWLSETDEVLRTVEHELRLTQGTSGIGGTSTTPLNTPLGAHAEESTSFGWTSHPQTPDELSFGTPPAVVASASPTSTDSTYSSQALPIQPTSPISVVVTGDVAVDFEEATVAVGGAEPTAFPAEFGSPNDFSAPTDSPASWPVIDPLGQRSASRSDTTTSVPPSDSSRPATAGLSGSEPPAPDTQMEMPSFSNVPVNPVATQALPAATLNPLHQHNNPLTTSQSDEAENRYLANRSGQPSTGSADALSVPASGVSVGHVSPSAPTSAQVPATDKAVGPRSTLGTSPVTAADFTGDAAVMDAPAAPGRRTARGLAGQNHSLQPPAVGDSGLAAPHDHAAGQVLSGPTPSDSPGAGQTAASSAQSGQLSHSTAHPPAGESPGAGGGVSSAALVSELEAMMTEGHALEATQPRSARVGYTDVVDRCRQQLEVTPGCPAIQLVMAQAHLEVVRLDSALSASRALPRAVHAVGILEHLHKSLPERQDIALTYSRAQLTAGGLQQDYDEEAAYTTTTAALARVSRAAGSRLTDEVADLLQPLVDQYLRLIAERSPQTFLDDATGIRDLLIDAAALKLDAQLRNKAEFLLELALRMAHHVGAVRSAPADAEAYCFVAQHYGTLLASTQPERSAELLTAAQTMRDALNGEA